MRAVWVEARLEGIQDEVEEENLEAKFANGMFVEFRDEGAVAGEASMVKDFILFYFCRGRRPEEIEYCYLFVLWYSLVAPSRSRAPLCRHCTET